jgi:hypothetical protein
MPAVTVATIRRYLDGGTADGGTAAVAMKARVALDAAQREVRTQ